LTSMSASRLALLTTLSICAAAGPWDYLESQLAAWPYTDNFAVEVGNATHGRVYLHVHGNFSMDTKVQTASTSKWPIASMLTGLVNDGTMSLDDKPSKYLKWWTTDPSDKRSKVTLRMLLSFTSGFGGGAPGDDLFKSEGQPACMFNSHGDFMECAQKIYENVKLVGQPGHVFSYNSFHLQLAGAMAVAASGMDIRKIIDKHLVTAFNMSSTVCGKGASNPVLAVCLEVTGNDYSNFLSKILDHSVISESITKQMEKDYTPYPIMFGPSLFGHYCFGHFYECFDSAAGFTEACREADVHADPGAFGYYPLIDRKNEYWFQVVAEESGQYYNRSGIPEYIRLLTKPYVDLIMRGESAASADRTEVGKLTLSDVTYINTCYNNLPGCS